MPTNPMTCSNCGTENPAGQDYCLKCNQPLTASAEAGLRESLDAQDQGGLFGAGGTATQGSGLDVGVMGGGASANFDPARGVVDLPAPADAGRRDGLPPRRS